MKKPPSPAEQERRKRVRLEKAEKEADQLRRIVNLHESLGLSWAEAQARVGLTMPHSTFHQRLAKLQASGVEGLADHRHPPPSPLTAEIRGFIEGLGHSDPTTPTKVIQAGVKKHFLVEFSIRTIEEVLQSAGLARPRARIASNWAAPFLPPNHDQARIPGAPLMTACYGGTWSLLGSAFSASA